MIILGRDDKGLVSIVFQWSDRHGECYECGAPAAFWLPPRGPIGEPRDHEKRCAVCAANAAVDEERVLRIDPNDA